MSTVAVMDALDAKLLEHFDGKVVRKDLLHRIKKGTNVPTFVLEFLLARYCASDEPAEIQAGLEAVLATLQDNYVKPDEANAAQSKVATKGKHRFIDKVHVRYVEKEKRHWAALENFNSQRIAVAEKFGIGAFRVDGSGPCNSRTGAISANATDRQTRRLGGINAQRPNTSAGCGYAGMTFMENEGEEQKADQPGTHLIVLFPD